MAIVKMSSFSLFTFDSDRDRLLHELQKFGSVHFTDLKADETLSEEGLETLEVPADLVVIDEEIQSVKYALDLLKQYDQRESGIKAMIKGKDSFTFQELEDKVAEFDYDPIISKFRALTGKIDHLSQEEMKLKALTEELRPWKKLDYEVKSLRDFTFSEVFTGTVPKKLMEKLKSDLEPLKETHFEVLSEGKDEAYILGITSSTEREEFNEILRNNSYTSLSIPTEGTPTSEMEKIRVELSRMKSEKAEVKSEIKSMANHLPQFEEVYEYLLNKKLRFAAESNFLKTENVNVISGYVPTEKAVQFRKAVEGAQDNAFYLEIEDAVDTDKEVPILLKNGSFSETFESLTTMYALPTYNSVDPTPYLAPFYFAFFGMMVADLAYGIILLAITGVALKFFNLDKGTKLFVKFLFYLSFSVIAWGLIYGSFFGDLITLPSLIAPMEQYTELLVISIIFGGIHLFYALAIKAYLSFREGKPLDALFDVGFWYMALMGAIGFLAAGFVPVPDVVQPISMWVMIIGMVGIVLTGGRENKSVGGKLAGGFYSLYGISGYIGDFVSYSRLMALGLSGGFIAVAMNMIMNMLFDMGPIGILPGIIIFVFGQLFNLFLSALSAYVHTSRLTYVEFFGKFYEGGGKAFKLFRNKSKYINVE
ncbi:V-type ATP synthase subunit I [Proteiniclasticum sp. SCR006]|uniref:V-type ATP synthase subunit I n=1 Tax=Proteiniclasticum aestuarii TaxID=2817862 RepID=A0A939KIJ3_9CLOT|nr:V-type ATP synthase subunit I [Proteiniclasticum aestuarii]MBO1264208.1 V-type ATP synthase subunit I [Proteiniclasticum aestuarii]